MRSASPLITSTKGPPPTSVKLVQDAFEALAELAFTMPSPVGCRQASFKRGLS